MTPLRDLIATEARILPLLGCIGTPYWWGHGDPKTQWPPSSCDCSGFSQMASVKSGELKPTEPDRNAAGLANVCDPVKDEPKFGDFAFYGSPVSHVMYCIGGGWVIGASGGGSNTHGDDPNAFVKLYPLRYRNDLLVVGRLKQEHRA